MLLAVFLAVVVDLVGFGLILPLLPFYAMHFGASAFEVALLSSVFSLAQFASAPLVGSLSDRIGRKKVFLACTALSALAYLGLAFADTLLAVFLARVVSGIGAGKVGIAQAIVADSTTPDKRARGMGLIGAGFGIGMILGPVIGGLLIGPDPQHPNYTFPAFAAAAASFTSLVLAAVMLRETLASVAVPSLTTRNPLAGLRQVTPEALALIGLMFVIHFVFAQIETLFPLFAGARLQWGPFEVGIAFTFIGIIVLAVQGGLIGPLTRRFGEARLLVAAILGLGIGCFIAGITYTVPILALSIAFTATSFAVINPTLASLLSRAADPEHQGLTLGTGQSLAALSRVLGPMLGGFLFEVVGIPAPYILGSLLLLCAFIFAWMRLRRTFA